MDTKRNGRSPRPWRTACLAVLPLALAASGCLIPKRVSSTKSTFSMVTEQEGSSGAEVTARLKDGFIEVVAIERRACVERSVEERLTVTRTETLVSSPPNNELAMTGAIVAAPVMGAITGLVHATADKTPREELIEHSRQSVDCSKPIAHARVEAGGQVFKTNQWGRLRFRVPQTPVRGPWKVAVSGLSATPTALTLTVVDTRGDDLQ